ncbi:hypothetical protein ACL655_16905 [Klebsiella quasipneumoniae subsp. similipneumoniae]
MMKNASTCKFPHLIRTHRRPGQQGVTPPRPQGSAAILTMAKTNKIAAKKKPRKDDLVHHRLFIHHGFHGSLSEILAPHGGANCNSLCDLFLEGKLLLLLT